MQVKGRFHGRRTGRAETLPPFEPGGRVVSYTLIFAAIGCLADQFSLRFSL